jgi:hypothetical protein
MRGSRGVGTRDVKRCFELVGEEARSRYEAAESAIIDDVLRAGIEAVTTS